MVACSSSSASGTAAKDGGAGVSKLYVAMMNTSEVVALDETSHAILERFPVGKYPTALVETPDFTKLYATNLGDNTVSAIDLATHAVESIPIAGAPAIAVASPDGQYVYVALGSKQVAVISTASDTVTRTLAVDDAPASLAISPDGATLYLGAVGASLSAGAPGPLANKVEGISAMTGAVVQPPLGVGNSPAWMSISPDGAVVYTFNALSGDVSVVDTAHWSVTTTVSLGGSSALPGEGVVSGDGRWICATNFGTANVVGIDGKTNQVVWTAPSDGRPGAIAFRADGTRGYYADSGHDSLSEDVLTFFSGTFMTPPTPPPTNGMEKITAFDPMTGEAIGDPIPLPGGPGFIIVSPR
jgi:YVTN family beta-propeller protein